MRTVAEVLVLAGGELEDRFLSYGIPEDWAHQVPVGAGVIVPLGGRTALGIVLALRTEEGLAVSGLKPVEAVLNQPLLTGSLLTLVDQIRRTLLCSMADAVSLALPPLTRAHLQSVITLVEPVPSLRSHAQQKVVEALRAHGGCVTLAQLKRKLANSILQTGLAGLRNRGLVRTEYALQTPSRPAQGEVWIELVPDPERLEAFFQQSANRARAQSAVLIRLLLHPEGKMPMRTLLEETGARASSVQLLESRGLIRRVRHLPTPPSAPSPPPRTLTPHQQRALSTIQPAIRAGRYEAFLLYGVTGSGKTEVYLRASAETLRTGRTVLFLVPEIALTVQLTQAFRERFGEAVAVLHSQLSPAERYAHWLRVCNGQAPIVIGARSAVFAPLTHIGLIIVDEEHEASYKHSSEPTYHARELAIARAQAENAVLVLGSATPSLESFYRAEQGVLKRLDLPERVGQTSLPSVEIVDMRGAKFQILTAPLLSALQETVSAGYQAILFLNRRGYAPFLLCRECGYVPMCPNCSVSLTYHRVDTFALRCHHCGHQARPPSSCPRCRGVQIAPFGVGTQRVEQFLREHLPHLRVARLDRDVLSGWEQFLEVLRAFRAGELDVLVGTQVVARGLDFPRVMLVGVISADMGLRLPDFRASERTFQLLMQVAGRTGRRENQGRVIIQTYCPDHPAIRCVQTHDYERFYRYEMAIRREPLYPPYCRLVNLLATHENPNVAESLLNRLLTLLHEDASLLQILGPVPAPLERLEGRYRYHMLLKFAPSAEPAEQLEPILHTLTPRERRWVQVDIDPLTLV
ncbi:MAG: primosomal protein N' [Armatimonadota bacterium]